MYFYIYIFCILFQLNPLTAQWSWQRSLTLHLLCPLLELVRTYDTLIPPFTATSITNLNKLENLFFWSHLIFSFCCQIHVFIPNKFKTTEGKNFRCVWTLNCWTFCSSGELTSLTRPLVVLNGSSEPEGRKIPCTPTTAPTEPHQQYYTWVCVYTDTSHTPLCSISFLWAVSSPCWINK